MRNIGAVLATGWAMAGCTGGSPSQSEIERAVVNAFTGVQLQQCERIAIENIQKSNGVKIDDSTYQIMATYDVRVIPVDGYSEAMDALQSKLKVLAEERRGLEDEVKKTRDCQGQLGNPSWLRMHPECTTDANRALVETMIDTVDRWRDTDIELDQKMKEVRNEWGSDYCYMIIGSGFGTGQFGFKDPLNAIMVGGVNSFERTFNLMRTDNGWMELE